ncbi:dynein heavy chain, N-terminal region 1-domain-containing protein [Lipomyces japonicus]|uniref:dynein heavy chain, N-terminal region 1-domain-containing protein n=1 Tax=Lipomyces japonicus TaxID=56871 RepID=UPI0034CE0808
MDQDSNQPLDNSTARAFDTDLLISYLRKLLGAILGASSDDLDQSLFVDNSDTVRKLTEFGSEPNANAIFVFKCFSEDSEVAQESNLNLAYSYTLRTDLIPQSHAVATLSIIKRAAPLDFTVPLELQLQIINLPSNAVALENRSNESAFSPYESVYSLMHLAIGPYFDALIKKDDHLQTIDTGAESESKTGFPAMKRKFAELELSLLNLQQNMDIPQLALTFHPVIQKALDTAAQLDITPTIALIPNEFLSDSRLLNSLQSNVNSWVKSIQGITKLTRDPSNGTASQEINFWLSMEHVLADIDRQLHQNGVILTMEILKQAKRFHATMSFMADTGLKESAELVHGYNILMNEFPIDEILSASSIAKLKQAVTVIFVHLNKKIRISPYPIRRALPLVEAISADLESQFHVLLSGRLLMNLDFTEFTRVIAVAEDVFTNWDSQIREFTNVAREMTRKRSEKFIPIRIKAKHIATQERIDYIKSFRQAHEKLHSTIMNVLGPQEKSSGSSQISADEIAEELNEAYSILRDVDVLDISPEGTKIWISSERTYNERTSRIEDSIIVRLRDKLAAAKTAKEMFRVFSKFNALFIRPKIRGAIQEYQAQLIEHVKADIKSLHNRFLQKYQNSDSFKMANVHDIPQVSGAIIWVQQIERQLNFHMKRVEDILGSGWELYSEGEKLKNESTTFRHKLNAKAVYDKWLEEVSEKRIAVNGNLFTVLRSRSVEGSLEISINFQPHIISLFKEVRNLTYLKFQVPHAIANVAKDAKRAYPYAMSLDSTLQTYTKVCFTLAEYSTDSILLNEYQNIVQNFIKQGMQFRWELFSHPYSAGSSSTSREAKHLLFVRDISYAVSTLQRKLAILIDIRGLLEQSLEELKICDYSKDSFKRVLGHIQELVDKLNLENFSNLQYWLDSLIVGIEQILVERLRSAIKDWIAQFERSNSEDKPETIKTFVLEIVIRNQVISLSPPLESAQMTWYSELQDCLSVICGLEKPQASRYEVQIDNVSARPSLFSKLSDRISHELKSAYLSIEQKLKAVSDYTGKWLQFQSLWDLQPEAIYNLSDDLSKWIQLLHDIRKTRATFDTAEVSRNFGSIVVDYEQVQTRINAKYDSWQHDILIHFASILGHVIQETYSDLEKYRRDLEVQTLDMASTKRALSFLKLVQAGDAKLNIWADRIEVFRVGQATLSRNRYQFSREWIFIEQIEGEWMAFREILSKQAKLINEHLETLRSKIVTENKLWQEQVHRTVSSWNENKPVTATAINPQIAFATLEKYNELFNALKNENELLLSARSILEINVLTNPNLDVSIQEVADFKFVWSSLSSIWKSLEDLRETLWVSTNSQKTKEHLEKLIETTKEMPSRMRQYSSFEQVLGTLRQLLSICPILADLKSDVVKERHWNTLFRKLKPLKPQASFSQTSITLGNILDLDLKVNETLIKEILSQARGEMALEDFLTQMRDTWVEYPLDLVNYQNKCRLIKGWDELFEKCEEHMNSLAAMHHSPYFKQFEEDAGYWEEKLNKINILFDVWVDVQRQWVYLECIFNGNAEIKSLLPIESSRFQNANTDFLGLMKKVSKSSKVLDVANIAGAQLSLTRISEILLKVRKALGEYLERERQLFPRFYFVGDEDLLEIIGNSMDINRIQKHVKKMFAGITRLIVDEENSSIIGIGSKEAEDVYFKNIVSLIKWPKVNDWLKEVEKSMKLSLAISLNDAVIDFQKVFTTTDLTPEILISYIRKFPAQVTILASQTVWTEQTEKAIEFKSLEAIYKRENIIIKLFANVVLEEIDRIDRKKCEGLITELVHQRNVIEKLLHTCVTGKTDYEWLSNIRYYHLNKSDSVDNLQVRIGTAEFNYGYEYLGTPDRLIQTPLTDKCFLALTGALEQSLGGSPFGPAGTGKTETVKALGILLGRFVLVFNCDDTFNFQAMGRIFLGICQVGAWGCFDEFNRLEERILSAVSTQVQAIQLGLRAQKFNGQNEIELVGKKFLINNDTGIFITMNPGYAGRSNLPDNLTKLFRSVSMSRPDKELITEVVLYSKGFSDAYSISLKLVPLFDKLATKLSKQSHYDFGVRALKSVLALAGDSKRKQKLHGSNDTAKSEDEVIVQSIEESVAPKLVAEDSLLLKEIENEVFPGVQYKPENLFQLTALVTTLASDSKLITSDRWINKITQLYQIQNHHHGIMLVGETGSGKSSIWRTLLKALELYEGRDGVFYIIDSKVMSKDSLFGKLDATTREWTDGLFTGLLRKLNENLRGESNKFHWIVFDGDVDPEWAENLNSVLDDNKILTLPNGERLALPDNTRIIFEVTNINYATLATISRCGMVWFESNITPVLSLIRHYVFELRQNGFDSENMFGDISDLTIENTTQLVVDFIESVLVQSNWVENALTNSAKYSHVMEFSSIRAIRSLFSIISSAAKNIIDYNNRHSEFPLSQEQVHKFVLQNILLGIIWSFVGDCALPDRESFSKNISSYVEFSSLDIPDDGYLLDYNTTLPSSTWVNWQASVPTVDLDPHMVTETDFVIPTIDTVRNEAILYSCLQEKRSLILCGPPGSGKTMSLFSTLRQFPNVEVAGINFSSATSPELIIKTIEQYCEYSKKNQGIVLSPSQIGRRLVLFCDEINLPTPDKYGTQHVISFIRQLLEHNGFWRKADRVWITLENIQFVAACNPPTDIGRTPLSSRFLRHCTVLLIDYPGFNALRQIYGTFNKAILKNVPSLRGYEGTLTSAMIDLYTESQNRFTTAEQSHYIYSPRELTRWVKGIDEALKPLDSLSLEGLVRIWAHEALRLFSDRLVHEYERDWIIDKIKDVCGRHFLNIDMREAIGGPILYSNWLTKNYLPVGLEELREFCNARLKTFCEEELDVTLVLYDDALDHVLRIDRVFKQPQGHLILIGLSGSGKTTLTRFVAWMNGINVFQINAHKRYTSEDFDNDLREVLKLTGCKGQKVCFILDESNVLDSAFLERMNTLLANAEIPGLFEGDEFTSLMTGCREGARQQGVMLDSQEELYSWFKRQVVRNLHVVFTMNPPKDGLSSRATTSPALFNRCVLNWMGDWSDSALFHVGAQLTRHLDLDLSQFNAPNEFETAYKKLSWPPSHRQMLNENFVFIHLSAKSYCQRLYKQRRQVNYVTPRHFIDFISQFDKIFLEKKELIEEQQRHLNTGLFKLEHTAEKVRELRVGLSNKQKELLVKNNEANQKLEQMVLDQKSAEQKRAESLRVQAELEVSEQQIKERQEIVMQDLAQAEPAVIAAKESVSSIKKQHLSEVRSMANPPEAVKMTMEAVCTLLGHKVDNWRTVQSIIRREDFISNIVNFDTDLQMTRQVRNRIASEYLSRPNFNFELVNRASRACGPLALWLEAQVHYSAILEKIGPLREEVRQLSERAEQTRIQVQEISFMIDNLEQSIENYKEEYAVLISQVQTIKGEMSNVQSKINKSVELINGLSSEHERWLAESKEFEKQMLSLAGTSIIAAALLVYGGYFDQEYRQMMERNWKAYLKRTNILFNSQISFSDYLTSVTERNEWHNDGLPLGELYEVNALMLQRHVRYPLIIDTTTRTTEFLKRQYPSLIVTSFLDEAFVKQLESALRFGNAILINDADHFDPILNHVLNREYKRVGGRILTQLGKQEIDFSPNFKMFLSCKHPSTPFTADVISRTTVVNFTVTKGNLHRQCLDDLLKALRPDVDGKRIGLIKLYRDFKVKLRQLEIDLLKTLNDSQGDILDDDKVIANLQSLKSETLETSERMEETEGVIGKIEEITKQFQKVADAGVAIFTVLELLPNLNRVYQFSLEYFHLIFINLINDSDKETNSIVDVAAKVEYLVDELYHEIFKQTSRAVLHADRYMFATLLAYSRKQNYDTTFLERLFNKDEQHVDIATDRYDSDSLANHVRKSSLFDTFGIVSKNSLDEFVIKESEDVEKELSKIVFMKLLRSDGYLDAVEKFVASGFANSLLRTNPSTVEEIVGKVGPLTPISICSVPGFDASDYIESLAKMTETKCVSVAMGAEEGAMQTGRTISDAMQAGYWVMLKNLHLDTSLLESVDKLVTTSLSQGRPDDKFRLFMTMETTTTLPVNALQTTRIMMFEPAPGIRSSMRDTIGRLPKHIISRPPTERARIYLMLAWFHGVVLERSRYGMIGWHNKYEFNNADFEFGWVVIDKWIDSDAQGRSNLAPELVAWTAIKRVMTEIVYGGQVDDVHDREILKQLGDRVFTEKVYGYGYRLTADDVQPVVEVPEGSSADAMLDWIDALAEREPPTWLGLPAEAKKI